MTQLRPRRLRGFVSPLCLSLIAAFALAAEDDPADRSAEEGRRIVARHADAMDGEAKTLRPKNEPAAQVVLRAAELLRQQLETPQGPPAAATGLPQVPFTPDADPGSAKPRGRAAPAVKTAIVSAAEFARTYAAGYPREANLSRFARATASSTHPEMDDPLTALGGVRKRDTWSLRGGKGWFLAEWPEPVPARYVILFNRPPGGGDPWDSGTIEINGRPAAKIGSFTRGQVLVADLGEPVPVKTLKLTIEGQENPGLAGLEVHRAARR